MSYLSNSGGTKIGGSHLQAIKEHVILRANSMIFIIRDPVAIKWAVIKIPSIIVIVNKIIVADRMTF
jgi:hypothetical protein